MANSISGQALAGATITLSGTASAVTTAGPTGAYSFTGLSAGSYVVTPAKQGIKFTPSSANETIVATDITGVNFLGTSVGRADSTFTVMKIVDKVRGFGELEPIFNVAGYTNEPALTIATDVMTAICGTPFPHKWNQIWLPQFYTWSYQQDYALVNPDGSSVYDVEWLERGVAFDINSSAIPKPWVNVECGRSQPQRTGTYTNSGTQMGDPGFIVNSFQNADLYYGTWGDGNTGNPKLGNNPVAGSVYTTLLGTKAQPANPISQIIDANGNLLVLTGFGTEGTTAPLAAIGALPGTTCSGSGATTIWTVVDPIGLGIRILSVPSQTGALWQFNIVGQKPPVVFTSVGQTLTPLPDKYEPYFRAGFIAQSYRYAAEAKVRAKFKEEWAQWLGSLNGMRIAEDRELEEYSFVPERSVMGRGVSRSKFVGGAWPFNYPRL